MLDIPVLAEFTYEHYRCARIERVFQVVGEFAGASGHKLTILTNALNAVVN